MRSELESPSWGSREVAFGGVLNVRTTGVFTEEAKTSRRCLPDQSEYADGRTLVEDASSGVCGEAM
jgi:hypothetical protein